jgi:diguanylate cyclase (GGDEF)-like protein
MVPISTTTDVSACRVIMSIRRQLQSTPSLAVAYAALGALLMVVHASLEVGSLPQSLVYDLVGGSAVGAMLYGAWRHRPDRRLPWVLMAVGQASFVAGDLLWNWYEAIGESPFPSFADVLYLAGYPFIALGLLLLIRRRLGDGDRGGLLDAAILTTASAILSWTFLIQPQLAAADLDPLALAISLAYPVFDLLLIGVAMGLLVTPGARTPSFLMLAASLACLLVADQIYAVQNLDESYVSGGPLDSLYLASYVFFGVAALHPSMRRLTDPHPVPVTWLGPIRLLGLAAAMLTGPILVVVGPEAERELLIVAAGAALLSLLVLARLVGLVGLLANDVAQRRALEAQLSFQAYHDPLTGLTNRRRFMEATQAALDDRSAPNTVAALFIDLDDFKTVNDSLGHAAGDEVLMAVAQRLRAGLRAGDVAARLGGDEFGVLLTGLPDRTYATAAAERLLEGLGQPLDVAGRRIDAGVSIGIAFDEPAMRTVDELLSEADIAMYQAKEHGKGRCHVYRPSDGQEAPAESMPPVQAVTVRRPNAARSTAPRPI